MSPFLFLLFFPFIFTLDLTLVICPNLLPPRLHRGAVIPPELRTSSRFGFIFRRGEETYFAFGPRIGKFIFMTFSQTLYLVVGLGQ